MEGCGGYSGGGAVGTVEVEEYGGWGDGYWILSCWMNHDAE